MTRGPSGMFIEEISQNPGDKKRKKQKLLEIGTTDSVVFKDLLANQTFSHTHTNELKLLK